MRARVYFGWRTYIFPKYEVIWLLYTLEVLDIDEWLQERRSQILHDFPYHFGMQSTKVRWNYWYLKAPVAPFTNMV